MIHNVVFANKGTFIKSVKSAKISTVDQDGEIVSTSDYRQPFLPGVGRNYTPRSKNGKILIDMKQDELNKLVEAMELYDKNNNQIKTAPIHNPAAPFWNHTKVNAYLEYTGTNFDDEDPMGKFWLAVFRADPYFVTSKGDDNPALDGLTKFKVTKAVDLVTEKDQERDEVVKATELLASMDFDTKKRLLRALGIDSRDPSPEQVSRHLVDKVILNKDKMTATGERNIEMFFRLAETKADEINIRGIITRATSIENRIILKSKGIYYYGEIPMGRTLENVYDFLNKEENKDVLTEVALKVGADSNKGL